MQGRLKSEQGGLSPRPLTLTIGPVGLYFHSKLGAWDWTRASEILRTETKKLIPVAKVTINLNRHRYRIIKSFQIIVLYHVSDTALRLG